ncbi:MAG: T9SS type A sorting domain-containing protein [candidate division Zixibacteria bacterium]|nr:T9SS type A sorting domain-containing protein [candidate division Zixibacteria bacterium]
MRIFSIIISVMFLCGIALADNGYVDSDRSISNTYNSVKGANPNNPEQPAVNDIQDFTGEETFDTNLGEFTSYAVSGDNFIWIGTDGNPAGCAFFDDYESDNNSYLVSNGSYIVPDIDDIAFNFDQRDVWPSWYELHEVLITENFTGDPSTTSWTQLYEGVAPGSWANTAIDLAAYRGVAVTFAFHYTGNYCDEWYIDNVSVSEAEPPPQPECEQEAVGPNGDWTFATSDVELGPYVVYDNYICDHEIDIVQFYGLDLAYNSGWAECTEDPMTFSIIFYPDNGSTMPDINNPVAVYTIQPERVSTGIYYGGAYELIEWNAELDETCSQLEGWLSIQGVSANGDNCVFLWANSFDGDLISYQDATLNGYDLARNLLLRTSVDEQVEAVPTKIDMLTNYPNPFNAQTTIAFSLKESGNVTIDIYDVLGRSVDKLEMGYLQNNQIHTANYDASEISTGIYFYSLIVDGQKKVTEKFNLLK